ncbi:uncharacterized protein [Hetaerina americana]|uniref:uncharacterized protein n=1 Tax=Hetaerina americana TaxID=62018 RepID=UPI003A7F2B9D
MEGVKSLVVLLATYCAASTLDYDDILGQTTCGAQASFKVSQFVNPSYPGSDTLDGNPGSPGDCRFTVRVSDKRVCQLRLDLDAFHLSEPEVSRGGVVRCAKQWFQVRGALASSLGFIELCGDNSGQHLYIPVEASLGPTTVQLVISTLRGASAYRWKVGVTQVDCSKDKALAAPTGCLQYHRGDRGSFRSLGYGDSPSTLGRGVPVTASMPSGLDYAVCFRRLPGACAVRYSSTAFNLPPDGQHPNDTTTITQSTTTTQGTTTASTTTESTATTPPGNRNRTGKDAEPCIGAGGSTVSGASPWGRSAGGLGGQSSRAAAPSALLGPPFLFVPGGVLQGEGGGEDGKFSGDSLAASEVQSEMPGPVSVWVSSGRGGVNGTGFEVNYELLTANC